MTQSNHSVSHLTIQNLPTEMVELSGEDLQQIVGGISVEAKVDAEINAKVDAEINAKVDAPIK